MYVCFWRWECVLDLWIVFGHAIEFYCASICHAHTDRHVRTYMSTTQYAGVKYVPCTQEDVLLGLCGGSR